jgi:nitrogen regulatory protein PII 1
MLPVGLAALDPPYLFCISATETNEDKLMIMVRAIIRPEKSQAVLAALLEAGFSAITKMEVYGRGKQRGMRIGEVTYDELPKELILAVVNDADKDFVVDVILKNARTSPEGAFGDGKIFVSAVDEVYTVRTGARDDLASVVDAATAETP